MIVLLPGLFRNLPQPALAAVVITASLSLADIPGHRAAVAAAAGSSSRCRWPPSSASPCSACCPASGSRSACPSSTSSAAPGGRTRPCSGGSTDLPGYHDVRSYPDARQLPGLVIYRFDAPLFFANAKTFRDEILRLARAEPTPRWIVVAAEPITDVDTTAADVLLELDQLLDERGQSLVFAELKDPVRRKIDATG